MTANRFLIILFLLACGACFAQSTSEITFTHEDRVVYGVLDLPEGNGPHPVVIIHPGKGPYDRDAEVIPTECGHPEIAGQIIRPYRQLGAALAEAGYAVLRYDKLTHTYGSASEFGPFTFEKLWLTTESAIEFVKTREEIDSNAIILLGHSEGASVIPFIARRRSDVKALIAVAGSRTPFDTLVATELLEIAECPGELENVEMRIQDILRYFETIRTNRWDEQTPSFLLTPAAEWAKYISMDDSVSINYNLADLPTLFIETQRNAVPVDQLKRFIVEVDITDDFWRLDSVNLFMTPLDDPNLSPAVSDTIICWLNQDCQTTTSNGVLPELEFTLSPNPFSDHINLSFPQNVRGPYNVELITVSGEVAHRSIIDSPQSEIRLDLPRLASGAYVIKVRSDRAEKAMILVKK